ncbi:hypothetical protein Trydic_g12443, partial [Trypoxylus dichotomus]
MSDDPSLARILRLLDTGKGEDDGEDDESTTRSSRRKNHSDDMEIGPSGQVPGSRQVVDFEDLVFTQGSHFMANKRCQLPDGSFRKQRKGYEEVHVPALKPKPFGDSEKLQPIDQLPKYVQPVFDGFKTLNR